MALDRDYSTEQIASVDLLLKRLKEIAGLRAIESCLPPVPLEQWNVLVDSDEAQIAVIELELAAFRNDPDFPVELSVHVASEEDARELVAIWADSPGLVWIRP